MCVFLNILKQLKVGAACSLTLSSLAASWALTLGRKECLDQRMESSRFMSVHGLLPEIFAPVPSPPEHLDRHWPWEGQMGKRIKAFPGNNSSSQVCVCVCVSSGEGPALRSPKSTPKVPSRAE